jgi:hypothetical protein
MFPMKVQTQKNPTSEGNGAVIWSCTNYCHLGFIIHLTLTYVGWIGKFLNYVTDMEPTWKDLKLLSRQLIEGYIEWLSQYVIMDCI